MVGLDWDPVDTPPAPTGWDSLVGEVAELFRRCGVTPSPQAWETITAAIDIAADWWADFASYSGLAGDRLVTAARDSAGMSSDWRLRRHLQGPAGRPLVALLLGGDQWGRRARGDCGCEASLILWALEVRRSRRAGQPDPTPPSPVVRAWATTVALIDKGGAPSTNTGPDFGPTVAA
jgi:hypothetical protein